MKEPTTVAIDVTMAEGQDGTIAYMFAWKIGGKPYAVESRFVTAGTAEESELLVSMFRAFRESVRP
jgi:hypothetical protein